MRRSIHRALAVALIAVAAGCDSGATETVEFKKTDTAPLKDMQDAMIKNMKKKPSERYKTEVPKEKK